MIGSLIDQLQQRFQLEKRANVCLWFDEKREFTRLLPKLHQRLETLNPRPFHLLEYDLAKRQGQIWLRYQVQQALGTTTAGEGRGLRFVIYLPLSEDRLDSADEEGEHHLELLEAYKVSGLLWRVGGKRPTLFSFLKQAGVALPESPGDQRRLWDGGADCLLAKYVARHLDRPWEFWQTTITPDLAKARLLGDVDQTILDLAVDPETTWAGLDEKGLVGEFVESVRERYGFPPPGDSPTEWVQGVVADLALTEAFLAYGKPASFPFASRLPTPEQQEQRVQLLRRWLADANSRPAWDRLIADAEVTIDLSGWAASRQGLCFGFPHLARQRWERTVAELEAAVAKASSTREFFATNGAAIREGVELSRASHAPVGAWEALEQAGRLVAACEEVGSRIATIEDGNSLVQLYVEHASAIDGQHLQLRALSEEHEIPAVTKIVDRSYADYANALNQKFCAWLGAQSSAAVVSVPTPMARLAKSVWEARGKRAVVIVDGLRLDCAEAVKGALQGLEVTVEPLRTVLPTVTPVGMTALLPIGAREVRLEVVGNALHPKIEGKDLAQRQVRIDLLEAFGADCRQIDEIEASTHKPADLGELLVVFGHEDLDTIGHGEGASLIRHLAVEIKRLARVIRLLHRWGYPEVHVVTDHGFIVVDEDRLPPTVACDPGWCEVVKERFALVGSEVDVPLLSVACEWNPGLRVAFPPGTAFFKAEKSFSHGGATLQEMVVPHLVSRSMPARRRKAGVEVVLPTFTLMRGAVKVVLRLQQPPSGPQRQMELFGGPERVLALDVLRAGSGGEGQSVLAGGQAKQVELAASAEKEASVVLFFHSALSFTKGEQLLLDIRDAQSQEQFPPGGITLTVGRDL